MKAGQLRESEDLAGTLPQVPGRTPGQSNGHPPSERWARRPGLPSLSQGPFPRGYYKGEHVFSRPTVSGSSIWESGLPSEPRAPMPAAPLTTS